MFKVNTDFINYNIRKLRERDFITQEYMAMRLGISQNTYSKIELGKTKLTVDKLIAIADILQVNIADLMQENTKLK